MHRPTSTLRCLLHIAMLLWLAVGIAQEPLRIGVVLPGQASASSDRWNELLAARAWEQSGAERGGIRFELLFRDGGTTPANTAAEVRELVEREGVHAIVCCTTPVSAAAIPPLDEELLILTLAAAPPGERMQGPLTLAPDALAIARAVALDARVFGRGVGLMTLDNAFGTEVAAAVVAGLVEAGLPLSRAETFAPGTAVLTPEALLVAASDPSAVIVWGLPDDTLSALTALRARGYEGPVYLPWTVAREVPGGERNEHLSEALLAAPPSEVADRLPLDNPNRPAVQRYRQTLETAYRVYELTHEGALAFDALELLRRAAEQAVVYGVDPGATASFRQALRDALVALSPVHGAAGSYDWNGRDSSLALARGVVIATPGPGGLIPVVR